MINQQTMNWLHHRFGVSSLFFECVVHFAWGVGPGNASWVKRGKDGSIIQLGKLISKSVNIFWVLNRLQTLFTTLNLSDGPVKSGSRTTCLVKPQRMVFGSFFPSCNHYPV